MKRDLTQRLQFSAGALFAVVGLSLAGETWAAMVRDGLVKP